MTDRPQNSAVRALHPKRRKALLRSLISGTVVLTFVGLEFFFEHWLIKGAFYGIIISYLGLMLLRSIRERNTVRFQLENGTEQSLQSLFPQAAQLLNQELDLLSHGFPIGFLHAFSSDFSQIKGAAQSKPGLLDKLVDFAETAFPFQNIIVALSTSLIKRLSAKRFFRVSIAQADNGNFLFHARSLDDSIPVIQLSQATLQDCVETGARRILHQISAQDLTPEFDAYDHFVRALKLWVDIRNRPVVSDDDFEPVVHELRKALEIDPNFILAALYLAALHSIRRTRTSYFERARLRLARVVEIIDNDHSRFSPKQREKLKGLALALSCNLTSQWLHRFGKYEKEDEAIAISRENQAQAREAARLLKHSPLAHHELAFSLHSLEHIALQRPKRIEEIISSYREAIEQYTSGIELARKKKEFPALRRSSGNRAYAMLWLGAMLRHHEEGTIRISMLGAVSQNRSQVFAQLWQRAEREMSEVAIQSETSYGDYSIANLCLLYSLQGKLLPTLRCAQILSGLYHRTTLSDALADQTWDDSEIEQLDPLKITQYPEGANDAASGLLLCSLLPDLAPSRRALLRNKAIAYHQRCLELIAQIEDQNVSNARIRSIKQMTNLVKLLSYGDPKEGGPASQLSAQLNKELDTAISSIDLEQLQKKWLQALESCSH